MYCKKCGCKINIGDKICSDCGTKITNIEYNGGFWNLVNEIDGKENEILCKDNIRLTEEAEQNREENDIHKIDSEKNESQLNYMHANSEKKTVSINNMKDINRKLKKRMKVFCIVTLVFMIIFVIQSARFSILSGEYENIQNKYEILSSKYEDINSENEKLRIQLNKIRKLIKNHASDNLF